MGTFYRDTLHVQRFQMLWEGVKSLTVQESALKIKKDIAHAFWFYTVQESKFRAAMDHGKKFQSELAASLAESSIVLVQSAENQRIFPSLFRTE